MRVPADNPTTVASLKRRPLFLPLIFPMLGFIVLLVAVVWLALAYQQTTTVVVAVWDDSDSRGALLQLAGQVEANAAYALERSPFEHTALIFPGDPVPVRSLGAVSEIMAAAGDGSLLLLVHKDRFSVLMQTLDLSAEQMPDSVAGSLLVITIPSLGKASIVRIVPEK